MRRAFVLLLTLLVYFNEAQRQLVHHRKGGRALVLITLDGYVTAINPETGEKQVCPCASSHSTRPHPHISHPPSH